MSPSACDFQAAGLALGVARLHSRSTPGSLLHLPHEPHPFRRASDLVFQELLETTDDTVDTIATATGMGTATTLRRHFARTVGVPPDTYRRTFRTRTRPGAHSVGRHH
jgi:hypothetical protein